MWIRPTRWKWAALVVCISIARTATAEGLLDRLPGDVIGFVHSRNLQTLDQHLMRAWAPLLGRNPIFVTPGVVLQVLLGKDGGWDPQGEVMLAVYAGDGPIERRQLCVWLPVTDYAQFVTKLGGKADDRITVVTISGEDVLSAQSGKWAFIADPSQRARVEAMLDAPAIPPASLASMREWMNTQDVSVAVIPNDATRKMLSNWLKPNEPNQIRSLDDLFRIAGDPELRGSNILETYQRAIRDYLSNSPQLTSLVLEADAVAVGARMDDGGNVLTGVRIASKQPGWARTADELKNAAPPVLHRDGEFSMSGAGVLPRPLVTAAVSVLAQQAINEARNEPKRPKLDPQSVERLSRAAELAGNDVLAASVFHAPLDRPQGVYNNQFLALRVMSADKFVTHFVDVIQAWSELNAKAQPAIPEAFEVQKVTVGGRPGVRFSNDVAAAMEVMDSPEMRQTMERMFGPDRKLNIFVVPIDKQSVLVAEATQQQTEGVLASLDESRTANWDTANTAATNKLLPRQADWRFFVSPSGYSKWAKQEFDAVQGDGFFGNSLRIFPRSAPVGLAGGFADGVLWADGVVTSDTIRAWGSLLNQEQ